MKTLITLFSLVMATCHVCFSQSDSWTPIPENAVENLQKAFPDAQEITWRFWGASDLQARFRDQLETPEECIAYFSPAGELIEVHHPIDIAQLPEDVVYTATSTHKGFEIIHAFQIENDRSGTLYQLNLRKRNQKEISVRVNANGYLVTHVPTTR